MRKGETDQQREINRQSEGYSRGCRVHRRYGNEWREMRKGGKVREGSKTSDAKRRAGGQRREEE